MISGKCFALKIIWICLIALLPFKSSSQFIQSIDSKTIDSLEILLPGSGGESRVDLLNELAELYAWYNPEKAEIYSNESLESSIQKNYPVGEGKAIYTIGFRKHLAGDPLGASINFQKAIDIIEQTNEYYLLAKIYVQLFAVLLQDGNEREKALEYAPKILELYQKTGAIKDEAIGYLNLCGIYLRLGQFETGLEYLDKFWDLSNEVDLSNLHFGSASTVAGQCYFNLGKVDTALILIKKAINQYNTHVVEEVSFKSMDERVLGDYYLYIQELDSAGKYYFKSLETSKSNENAYNEMKTKYRLAYMYYLQSNYERCISYCDSAINISKYIDSLGTYYYNDSLKYAIAIGEDLMFPISKLRRRYYAWISTYNCYNMLWDSYLATGEKEKAIQIHQSWMDLLDSIYIYQRNKSILAINVSYETEKKEQEVTRLEEENLLQEMQLRQSRWIVAGMVFIVLMIALMASELYKKCGFICNLKRRC